MGRKRTNNIEFLSGVLLGNDLGVDIARQLKAGMVPNDDYVSEIHRRLAKAEEASPEILRNAVLSAIDTIEFAMGWA